MKNYRGICGRHSRLRCGECAYIEQLEEENKRLRKALWFYQKGGHYVVDGPPARRIAVDLGEVARKALEGSE